jgi:hypothetical protein
LEELRNLDGSERPRQGQQRREEKGAWVLPHLGLVAKLSGSLAQS